MKAELLARAFRRQREAEHAFQAGDEGGDEILAGDLRLFGRRERAGQHRGAGMHAGRGLAQVVELEGVGEGAVGEGGAGRTGAAKARADHGGAAVADVMDVVVDDAAPRQRRAERHHADGVDDAGLGHGDGRRRDVVVAQAGGELRQRLGLARHVFPQSFCGATG